MKSHVNEKNKIANIKLKYQDHTCKLSEKVEAVLVGHCLLPQSMYSRLRINRKKNLSLSICPLKV